jgi:hypothetical protein
MESTGNPKASIRSHEPNPNLSAETLEPVKVDATAAAGALPAQRSPERERPAGPRLLDLLRAEIRVRNYSIRTEAAYVDWVRRFILFHGKRHPAEMAAREVAGFLTHLAVDRAVAAPTRCSSSIAKSSASNYRGWMRSLARKTRDDCRWCSPPLKFVHCCSR